jgi:hypothetical protein
VKIARRPKRSANQPALIVPTVSPANNEAMKAAIPLVPNRPAVVGVNRPLAVSPGAMKPVISISYSSKKKAMLSRTMIVQTVRVGGRRSSRAVSSAAELEASISPSPAGADPFPFACLAGKIAAGEWLGSHARRIVPEVVKRPLVCYV